MFFRTCLGCFQSTQNPYVDRLGDLKYCFPKNLMKTALPRIEPATPPTVPTPPFTAATVFCLKGPAPWSCCWFAARSPVCSKKHIFFLRCSDETQTSPALQKKKQALKNCFFVCLLSNLPTPPRYLALARSKLRRCIQYITKNDLRIWRPWASSFRILNQLSGCISWVLEVFGTLGQASDHLLHPRFITFGLLKDLLLDLQGSFGVLQRIACFKFHRIPPRLSFRGARCW